MPGRAQDPRDGHGLYVLTLPLGWRKPPGWQRAFRPVDGTDVTDAMVERAAEVLEAVDRLGVDLADAHERRQCARELLAAVLSADRAESRVDRSEAIRAASRRA